LTTSNSNVLRNGNDGKRKERVTLDTVEDKEIINTGVMDHLFHLHTNRFQGVSRNGETVRDRAWKDTVLIATAERVRI